MVSQDDAGSDPGIAVDKIEQSRCGVFHIVKANESRPPEMFDQPSVKKFGLWGRDCLSVRTCPSRRGDGPQSSKHYVSLYFAFNGQVYRRDQSALYILLNNGKVVLQSILLEDRKS